jgi:hypothetical protein
MGGSSADRDEYRLTEVDELLITERMVLHLADYRTRGPIEERHAYGLTVFGLGAIGCCRIDMRSSELEWVDARAAELCGLVAS